MKLTERIAELVAPYRALCQFDLMQPDVFRRAMLFVYRTMLASTPLLEQASMASVTSTYDMRLMDYLMRHAEEERGHERWMRNDLAVLGIVPDDSVDWVAASVCGTQHYAIEHGHPATMLGYMFFVEGDPMPLPVVEALESIHGNDAMRTVRYHATNDVQHKKDLDAMIDAAPEDLHRIITESAIVTAELWVRASAWIKGEVS